MSEIRGVVREELLPILEQLCSLVRAEGKPEQAVFFERIRDGLIRAEDDIDLAGPFMELSTSAFHGFAYGPAALMLLDRALTLAQSLSMTLSAADERPH